MLFLNFIFYCGLFWKRWLVFPKAFKTVYNVLKYHLMDKYPFLKWFALFPAQIYSPKTHQKPKIKIYFGQTIPYFRFIKSLKGGKMCRKIIVVVCVCQVLPTFGGFTPPCICPLLFSSCPDDASIRGQSVASITLVLTRHGLQQVRSGNLYWLLS